MPDLITIDRVAKIFHVSKRTVYRWMEKGLLPKPIRMDHTVRFKRAEIEKLCN